MYAIQETMAQQYGPLLSTAQLAEILGRSEGGLRYTAHSRSPLGIALRDARVRIGRHVRYRTSDIARLLSRADMCISDEELS